MACTPVSSLASTVWPARFTCSSQSFTWTHASGCAAVARIRDTVKTPSVHWFRVRFPRPMVTSKPMMLCSWGSSSSTCSPAPVFGFPCVAS